MVSILSKFSSLFSSVRIEVLFANRPFRPGETIEMAIQLVTRDRLDVQRGRAELICEPRGQPKRDLRHARADGPWSGVGYAHSQIDFAGRRLVPPGGQETFSADLPIDDKPPAGGFADARWRLVVSFELTNRERHSSEHRVRVLPTWSTVNPGAA